MGRDRISAPRGQASTGPPPCSPPQFLGQGSDPSRCGGVPCRGTISLSLRALVALAMGPTPIRRLAGFRPHPHLTTPFGSLKFECQLLPLGIDEAPWCVLSRLFLSKAASHPLFKSKVSCHQTRGPSPFSRVRTDLLNMRAEPSWVLGRETLSVVPGRRQDLRSFWAL